MKYFNISKIYTGAEILFETFEYLNINEVFGYPGGAAIPLYDELTRRKKTIKHYLTAHEQGAIHSAEGYAKSNEKLGVVFTTSGPGATNITTGLANAYADSTPILAITSNVNSKLIGTNAFQEVNICKIANTITKNAYFVNDVKDLQQTLFKAFKEATTGRCGPVLVDITTDVYKDKCELKDFEQLENEFTKTTKTENKIYNFLELLDEISKAQKPIFYCGGGIKSNCFDVLYKIVKLTNFPIATTMNGLGVYPAYEKENLQMLGMHGTYEANMSLYNCDLMIVIGARFDDRVTCALSKFSPNSKKIHVDIDSKELNKLVKVDYPINMDCYDFLNQFYEVLKENKKKIPNINKWWKQIEKWREVKSYVYKQEKGKKNRKAKIKPQYLLDTLNKIVVEKSKLNKRTFIATDVGQHQVWTSQYLKFNDKRNFITSGGLGTMGFGLPSAIGAQIANKKDSVVLITGDGSFIMTMHEMATIKRYKIPVKIIVVNNTKLGMVKQWQELFYHKNYSEIDLESGNPNFVKNAKSFGIKAKRLTKVKNVERALRKLLRAKKPYLLEVFVDPKENVYPMIPVGKGHNEIILNQDC